jgi:hypothetical protein
MALDLNADRSLPGVFTAGVSVDNMTWWFWIKAGIGLGFGFMLSAVLWGLFCLMLFMGLGLTGWLLSSGMSVPTHRTTLRR